MKSTFFLMIAVLLSGSVAGSTQVTTDQTQIKRATAFFDKGVKAAMGKNLAQAERFFNDALAQYPHLPGAYVELGKIRMAQNRPGQAVEYYLKARSAYIQVHSDKITNLTRQQQREREIAQESNDARNTGTLASGGYAKDAVQQQKDEKRELDRNVLMTGEMEAEIPALFYLYLGGAYLRLGQTDLAEVELRKGIIQDGGLAPLHFNLAVIHLIHGNYPESAAEARLARKYGFQPPPAFVKDLETRGKFKF